MNSRLTMAGEKNKKYKKSKDMKINLCVYSNDKFKKPRTTLIEYARKIGIFDRIFEYDREWLEKTDFYINNKDILSDEDSKGDGWCLWKPYIIRESLDKINQGDILIYIDSTDTFFNDFKGFILKHFENNDFLLSVFGINNTNIKYTKKDTFLCMGCDYPKYWDSVQLEAGVSGFKKCERTISFVDEYLNFCSDPRIIKGGKSTLMEDPAQYIEHRYDQSVLSILSIKHNIEANREICYFVECNIWESLHLWGGLEDFSRKIERIKDTCGGAESENFKTWSSLYLPFLFID